MADLVTNINQAIADFNSIKDAIISKGIDIPNGTKTNEYAEKISQIQTGGGETELQFDMTGITHYYDITTIDKNNNVWVDSVNGNNIDISDCTINDDNIEVPSDVTKSIDVEERPSVLYCVLKKDSGETDSAVFGIETFVTGNDLMLWCGNDSAYDGKNFMGSCKNSPYMLPSEVMNTGEYHVFALYYQYNSYAGDVNLAFTYFDRKMGQCKTCSLSNYNKQVRLYGKTLPTYFKMVAIGHGETSHKIVANNCIYLCQKYNIGD